MNDELLTLQNRVSGVIYNPFVNLKDLVREIKKLLAGTDTYTAEIAKLDAAMASLDEFEHLPLGNLERIKGFNKIKSNILKIIKEVLGAQ